MESLSGIGSSLPPSVPDAELAHTFRGAALSLTALFKAGKNSTRKGEHSSAYSDFRCPQVWAKRVSEASRGQRRMTRVTRPLTLSHSSLRHHSSPALSAYLAGKREALQDVLEFIQASLDHPPSATSSGQPSGPLNVARLIDYLCVCLTLAPALLAFARPVC